ncbi:hypothetical protein ID866_9984 [Astraeus odoratus]|nr:hypothetical protein ID866_9984 [Astraeus odoratus]
MRAELTQQGNTYVEPNALICMPSVVISMHFTSLLLQTLAEELEDAEFRTPDGPGGSDPDLREPNDPDNNNGDNDDNASEPSIKDNPILALTNAITLLSHATRCRPKDSGVACTKVCEPNTFNGMDPKKLCCRPSTWMHKRSALPSPSAWFEPNLLDTIPSTEPAWADDYSEFVIKITTTNFSPHNPVSDADHQLDNLLMKDSSHINKYIVKFNCLATQVHGYREGALCHMFYNGLPDHIKDKIACIGH